MKIITELINSVKNKDCEVKEVYTFARFSMVVSRNCGIASVLKDAYCSHKGVKDAGKLLEKSAIELAEYALSADILEASIGTSAINSLIDIYEEECVEINAYDIIADKGKGKNVAIIGHFPFVEKLTDKVNNLWVIEKNTQPGDSEERETKDILPNCDVIGITGTTIINHTLEDILSYCKKDSLKILLGPSTPMSPILFSYGIDVISGTKIVDKDKVFNYFSQGSGFQGISGVRLLTMIKK